MSHETIEYKGFDIEIHLDQCAENPFEAWDCDPPIAVYYDRNINSYATKYGDVNTVPTLTREQIKANITEILALTGYPHVRSLANDRFYHGASVYDLVNEAISEHVDDLGYSDRLEALCDLYNMTGQAAIVRTSCGYSQRDYAEVLAVATFEFQKACGNATDYWAEPDTLEPSIDLYSAWAWGDVYGYSVEGIEDASCYGYYGNHETSGLLDDAKATIDWHLESERKQRTERIKTYIRNRVPLAVRLTA